MTFTPEEGAQIFKRDTMGRVRLPRARREERIRLANTRLASSRDLVGQFRVARAAGVSSAMRLIGKSPNPGSTEPR